MGRWRKIVSIVNSSLAFEEVDEQEVLPALNLLFKSLSSTRNFLDESQEYSQHVDFVITGRITVSF